VYPSRCREQTLGLSGPTRLTHNATAFGPAYWLLIAFALPAGLVTLIDAAIRIRG